MTYFRTDFCPEPISSFEFTHLHRSSLALRVARWATRPLKAWLYKRAIIDTKLRVKGYHDRRDHYLRARHDTAARQMQMLADVERAHLARLWVELDQLTNN